MMQKLMNRKNKKGFTLIELIVVIAIIAILAAIAIPRLGGFTARAQISACVATQRTMESAASTYEAQTGAQPASIGALVPTYLAKTPRCPTGGTLALSALGVASCTVVTHVAP